MLIPTTYDFRAIVIIRVEATSRRDAREFAEEVAEELNAVLPTGATLIHRDGHVEVLEN